MEHWALPPRNQSELPLKPSAMKQQDQVFLDTWAEHSAIWGTRHGIGEALDRYFGLHVPPISTGLSHQLADLGIDMPEMDVKSGPLHYSEILKLNNDHLSMKELSLQSFTDKVKQNTYVFRQAIQPGQVRSFFAEISPKTYLRETLWESNVKPFKELFSGSKQNLCMNLGYSAGVGLAGASIVKTGVQHYRYWKKQEDGSISSQWHTAYETGKAVCGKTIQTIGSWEAAGVGMAIGRALLPIGAIPIGGIIVGALFATAAYKAIGKLFPSLAMPGPSKS